MYFCYFKNKTMKKTFFVIFATIFCNPIFSGDHIDKDEFEVRYIKQAIHLNSDVQYHLRNEIVWKEFQSVNPNWFVYFNENNRKPHRAFGEGISITSPSDFIVNNLSVFDVPFGDLQLTSETENKKYKNYIYTQYYKDLEVLDSRLYLKMNKNNEVVIFGLDVFSDINSPVIPTLSLSDALISSQQNLPFLITESNIEEKLKILPIPENGKYTYHLVYVVHLNTQNNIGPAEYLCYVDANSGELLMRRNEIKYEVQQANVHVEGEVYTTNPFNSSSVVDLVDLKVRYNNTNYYTDSLGEVVLPSNTGNATYYLEGLYTQVQTNSTVPSFNTSLSNSNVVFDNTNSTISERTAFYAVNNIHNHFKNQFPTFTGLDYAMETNVDITTSTCNAFYGGGTINFYDEGGGCNASAKIPDVAYHEYGHAINDYRYNNGAGMWNGGLNEGTADIWALSLTEYPVLGEGWLLNDPNSNVREYDSVIKVYPQDLVGEVHADGEIICGAFWHTYENLGNMQQALDLFSSIYDGGPDGPDGTEGIIYTDVLLEFLYSDDNDGNIFNGTPNDNAIVDAFALHGITLLSNAVLTHSEIDESLGGIQIDVDANIVMTYPWVLNNAYCYYKLNNSTIWDSIPLSIVSGNDYAAQIPSQVDGTVIAYYLSLVDNYGKKAAITPFSAHLDIHANLPYFILVGYELMEEQDFDFNIGFWDVSHPSDNASTGLWEIGVPEGTYYDNTVPVQTSTQHTFQGAYCAFTGNDMTGGTIGANDVDGGHTTLTSPTYDLTDYTNPTFTYYRWYTNSPPTGANPGADWWQVQITDDGSNWVYIENNMTSDNRWRKFSFRVTDYVNITSDFSIRFIASDSIRLGQYLDGGSLVEAAIDDVYLYDATNINSIIGLNLDIDVFPNPTKGVVKFSLEEDAFVKVINTLGEIIIEKQLNISDNEIDLSAYNKGIYYLEIKTKNKNLTKKIVLE
jgi:hypothetical protein